MKYVITGGTGQLGTELTKMLENLGWDFTSFDSSALNIENQEQVKNILFKEQPDVVFHCAAYTAVDAAEDEGKDRNWSVNVEGTKNVAEICRELNCQMVYISTDYVFDGVSNEEYKETDQTNPLNEYGKAKLAGEQIVKEIIEKHYTIRTSWVYGEYGANFVYTMKRLAETHSELTVIDDQLGRPTWTKNLAEFMIYLVETNQDYGTYHFSNLGSGSWFDFAKEILKDSKVRVEPILTRDYYQKAQRPKKSIMSLSKALNTGFVIPHWKDALSEFKQSINNN